MADDRSAELPATRLRRFLCQQYGDADTATAMGIARRFPIGGIGSFMTQVQAAEYLLRLKVLAGGWEPLLAALNILVTRPASPTLDPDLVAKLAMSSMELPIYGSWSRQLTTRVRNFVGHYYPHVIDLVMRTEDEMRKRTDLGVKSVTALKQALAKVGLGFGMTIDEATIAAVSAEIARQRPTGK